MIAVESRRIRFNCSSTLALGAIHNDNEGYGSERDKQSQSLIWINRISGISDRGVLQGQRFFGCKFMGYSLLMRTSDK